MRTPPVLGAREVSALIGLLAVVEGDARSGKLPLDLQLRLRQRFAQAGVLTGARHRGDAVETLDELGRQLRALEGTDGDQDAALDDVPLVNVVAFAEGEAAQSFAQEMQQLGRDVDDPVHEPAFRRWVVAVHTQHRGSGEATAGTEYMAARTRGGWHLGAF